MRRALGRALVPAILSAGLIAFLLAVADFRTLRRAIVLPWPAIATLLVLTALFLSLKGLVWYKLVRRAQIPGRTRDVIFAYLGGETTKVLPGGIYFQNYLLGKLSGTPPEYGVATSLVLVGMDAAAAMALVMALGIRGWPWLRPVLGGVAGGWMAVLLLLWRSGLVGRARAGTQGRWPMLNRFFSEADLLYRGIVRIWHPWFWLKLWIWTALYVFVQCLELWVLSHAIAPSLTFGDSMAAAAVSILLPMLLPVPVQLGFSELSGSGALAALGLPFGQAVGLMFALRVWGTGLIFPLALGAMAAMPDVWRRSIGPWSLAARPEDPRS